MRHSRRPPASAALAPASDEEWFLAAPGREVRWPARDARRRNYVLVQVLVPSAAHFPSVCISKVRTSALAPEVFIVVLNFVV
jgi:hypothetical protein